MGVKVEILGDNGTTLTNSQSDKKVIVSTQAPVGVTGQPAQRVTIEVLKGVPGDQRVFAGPTPPENPQEGWIWVDTSE